MSSDCSPGDFACEESKITEIRNSVGVEASVKEVKIPQACALERPHTGRVTKKLLILDVNGLLADIVSYVSAGYQANIVVSGKSGEYCCVKRLCIARIFKCSPFSFNC
jgi:hypothetical protein